MSKKSKRIIISLLIVFTLGYFSICFYTASMLTKKAEKLVITAYESCGAYDESTAFISEHDYNQIAAAPCVILLFQKRKIMLTFPLFDDIIIA